jgi:hypothetical protein
MFPFVCNMYCVHCVFVLSHVLVCLNNVLCIVLAGAVVVPYGVYVFFTSCGEHFSCLSYVLLGAFLAF